ncbi:hypothetical protein ES705_20660 [subsurface metagenome]
MIFFSGFNTIFPYLIYLSAVWICVLIGFRGQFLSALKINHEVENISILESEAKILNHNCFVLPAKKEKESFTRYYSSFPRIFSYDFQDLLDRSEIRIAFVSLIGNQDISGHYLRAPPSLTF